MTITANLRYAYNVLATPALRWAVAAGITTRLVQYAISSFFRAPSQWVSLMTRVNQLPGGQTLLNLGPSFVVGFAVLARLLYSGYKPSHATVDAYIRRENAGPGFNKEIDKNCTAVFCSNYPKDAGYDPFCDAYGYVETNQVQIIAIADGCGLGHCSQQVARAMVDGFFASINPFNHQAAVEAKAFVLDAAQSAQKHLEKEHKKNEDKYAGATTTFLGGKIFTALDGKRYFAGVNCGDCKLYHLTNTQFVELTKPARTNTHDSGGRFGPGRDENDKTEYDFSVEVKSGDQLIFMTDGVHDNLDKNPGENEELGAADARKLDTLQRFSKADDLGLQIMRYVFDYTRALFKAGSEGKNMKTLSKEDYPGKLDHMTLLVVKVS